MYATGDLILLEKARIHLGRKKQKFMRENSAALEVGR